MSVERRVARTALIAYGERVQLGVVVIKHFLNPPNWFTSASIFCSTYAVALIVGAGEITPAVLARACVLVIFGGVFDLLDGRVARLTNRFSEFGVQLDSIADMVGFGLAPAIIAWAWLLKDLGSIGVAITFWYVLCAAFRLARFNVDAAEHEWSLPGHSQGLTSTMSGGTLVTLIWVSNGYLDGVLRVPPFALATLVFLLGLLMISSLPIRNFRDLRNNKWARRYLAITLGFCLVAGLVLDISIFWGAGALIYLATGVVDGTWVAFRERRLRKAFLVEDFEEAFEEAIVDE